MVLPRLISGSLRNVLPAPVWNRLVSSQYPLICRAAVCQEGSPGAAGHLSSTGCRPPCPREPGSLPACPGKPGLNDARGEAWQERQQLRGSSGEVLRPCVGGSPAQDPRPSLQSLCGRWLDPAAGGSVFAGSAGSPCAAFRQSPA